MTKLIFSSLISLLLFTNCKNQDTFNPNSKNLSYEEYMIQLYNKDLTQEEICLNEINRAIFDINQNKLTFFYQYGIDHHQSFAYDVAKILKKENISAEEYLGSSCLKDHDSECTDIYIKLMDKEITKRYGAHFKNSILEEAYQVFHKNNPEHLHEPHVIHGTIQHLLTPEYQDFYTQIRDEFLENFTYPKNFILESSVLFSTQARFTVSKNGDISNITVNATFENKVNKKHKSYFESELKSFLSTKKWQPVKCMGDIVNGIATFTFYYHPNSKK